MRVLALHGFRTSGQILSEQLKPLKKALPDWEFYCPNAPNVAQGEPDEIVKLAFPNETNFYEWYNVKRLENGALYYESFEESVNLIQSVVTRTHYDVILGFSQGGCFAAMLTALCEQGVVSIPSHRRWKCAVLMNAPYPRGDRVSLGPRWCTPSLLCFGNKDSVIDPAPWSALLTATKVLTDEGHALPRQPRSVEAVAKLAREITSRRWVAFDFDGVVCDSARETGVTAWLAGAGLFPGADGQNHPDAELLEGFCLARPLLETGFEALVIMYRLAVLKESPVSMLGSPHPAKDMETALQKMGVPREELKDRFQRARDEWIARNEREWLSQNGFYAPVVAAMKRLIARSVSVYVVTTKHASFAAKLLASVGVNLPPDRLFGLGSGKKREVLSALAREREAALGGSLVFIEDRVETLRDVAQHASVAATLVVAGHGYNTAEERRRAREEDGFDVMDTAEQLGDWLDSLTGNRTEV